MCSTSVMAKGIWAISWEFGQEILYVECSISFKVKSPIMASAQSNAYKQESNKLGNIT